MNPITILSIVASYFALLFGVGWLTSRRVDNQGFFVGGRRSRWYVVAFAMIGASISGVTFVSVPGMVAGSGFSYLQMVMGFFVGQIVIAFVLIPLFYRMNLTSIYQYLENRFGLGAYGSGAWFFFVSKMLGAGVRLLLVCAVLQLLAFGPLGVPFWVNASLTVGLVWLYTFRGGVKTLIWTDSLKTLCLVVSVGLTIFFIASELGLNFTGLVRTIERSDMSRIFFFDDVDDRRYFFKQFLAGIFTVIAITGLDQDMMQRNLSCRNYRDSQKNILISGALQIFVNLLFLALGVLLYTFALERGVTPPQRGDELFPMLATGGYFPAIVGVLFIVGLISSAYSAAGSALTALTTSFTVDILGHKGGGDEKVTARTRRRVHIGMAVVMGLVIVAIERLNNTSVIDAVYILASYTYGPILGMFAFGILTRFKVKDKWVPLVAVAAPMLCFIVERNSIEWFNGYRFGYEILVVNAALTFAGMLLLIRRKK